jgi:hypothetical protein
MLQTEGYRPSVLSGSAKFDSNWLVHKDLLLSCTHDLLTQVEECFQQTAQ